MEYIAEKENLHERSLHRFGYDFIDLVKAYPELEKHLIENEEGFLTIEFSNPTAVHALNAALLSLHYDIKDWIIPEGFLIPPVPSRVDYIHNVADLLAEDNSGTVPKGSNVHMIDIGVGANAIYSLLAQRCYRWQIIGVDINEESIQNAQKIITANKLDKYIKLNHQKNPDFVLKDLFQADQYVDITVCNPPFFSSLEEAQKANERKWNNLKKEQKGFNFGGNAQELWYDGGEIKFLTNYIEDSQIYKKQCLWFTSLVSKEDMLPQLDQALEANGVIERKVIEMSQGQKKSRILCWTYFNAKNRKAWAQYRWRK